MGLRKDDALKQMFERQRYMQEGVYGYDFAGMSDEDRVAFVKEMVLATEDELHEALNETGWKPWATSRHINRDAYKGELVDVMHFVLNLALVAGITADDLFEGYMAKSQKNIRRQEAGYDGIAGKCPMCRRAYDDEAVRCDPGKPGHTLSYCETNGFFKPFAGEVSA